MRKYLAGKLKELATARGISSRKAAEMARRGEIPGARKVGNRWQVPLTTQEAAAARGISVRTAQRQAQSYNSPLDVLKPKKPKKLLMSKYVLKARRLGLDDYFPRSMQTEQIAKDYLNGIAKPGKATKADRKARERFEAEHIAAFGYDPMSRASALNHISSDTAR